MEILYSDNEIVVCLKEKGYLSQQGAPSEKNMVDALRELTGKPVYPVHRLDKEVEGVMVYAHTKQSAAELSRQVSERIMEKSYFAVTCEGTLPKQGELTDLLYFDKTRNKSFVVKRERKGVKKAVLSYCLVEEKDKSALYDICLHTGRTHQIRVQFASRHQPLCGDRRYGSKEKGDIALFSRKISFVHPTTGKAMTFEKEPQNGFFAQFLSAAEKETIDT